MSDDWKTNQRRIILTFTLYFILSIIFVFLVQLIIERKMTSTKSKELMKQEERVVKLERDYLSREFNTVISDLHYLHNAYKNDLTNSGNFKYIANKWKIFSEQRKIYDQIRFLDIEGNEKIRINFIDNKSFIVPSEELQNKKDRYYFTKTINLKENHVYISTLDLNIEHNKIEIPYKPMIRLSTPVYSDDGNLNGIIVLNYLAEHFLSSFRELAKNSQGEIILINKDSYRLSSEDFNSDWNFMFKEKINFSFEKEYSEEWTRILSNEPQFITDNGLFTSIIFNLNRDIESNIEHHQIIFDDIHWIILSLYKKNRLNSEYFYDNLWEFSKYVITKNKFYFLAVMIILGILFFLIYLNQKTYFTIKYYSEYDALTKVLNRRAGMEKLNNLISLEERRDLMGCLCFIDINGLKEVNDTLGHKSGDELITTTVSIIKNIIREQDFLIRLGGDEFLIIFKDVSIEMAEEIWKRMLTAFNQINESENRSYVISVSHGIVDFNNKRSNHIDTLIHEADKKMYEEKQMLKSQINSIKRPQTQTTIK